MGDHSIDGLIGADVDVVSTDAKFALGTVTKCKNGQERQYVRANGAIGAFDLVIIDEAYDAIVASLTTSAAAFGQKCGVAEFAVADNEFFWVVTDGETSVNVLASAPANAVLNTTATDGTLDNDSTAGAENITGLALQAANGGSTAAVACFLNHPGVGTTEV